MGAGKGSATLSMAYAGARLGKGSRRHEWHSDHGVCICSERCDAWRELLHQQGDFREEWRRKGPPCRPAERVREGPTAASNGHTQEGNPIRCGLCRQNGAWFMSGPCWHMEGERCESAQCWQDRAVMTLFQH